MYCCELVLLRLQTPRRDVVPQEVNGLCFKDTLSRMDIESELPQSPKDLLEMLQVLPE